MKKLITAISAVLFFVLFPANIFAEKSNLVTQLKVYNTDSVFWYFYFYDNNANKVLEIKYYYDENLWKRSTQTEWIYNDNKCVTQREKKFINGDWENKYEISYTYEDGKLISEKHFMYLNDMEVDLKLITFTYDNNLILNRKDYIFKNNSWLITQLTENTYNNNQLVSTIIKKISQNVSENQEYKIESQYNTDGKLAAQTLFLKNSQNEWMNNQKTVWYYNLNQLLTSERVKVWNAIINDWENASMVAYKYTTDNKILSEVYYFWESTFWENTLQYIYEYDAEGLLNRKVIQMPIFRKWRTISSIDYSNFENSKANLMETKLTFWGENPLNKSTDIPFAFNSDTEIMKANQIIISYEKVDNTDISTNSFVNGLGINIYPNPSDGIFYFNPEKYNIESWTVFDVNGKIAKKSSVDKKSGVIDLTNLSEGIYLLQVVTPDNVLSQKLIRK